jgi:tagatose 6-phosphate kinase
MIPMILCVTLNPCLDKTLTVPAWRPGDAVRGRAVREVVGGKGNNVARALSRLGRRARPVTFLGGAVGVHCAGLLQEDDGLDPLTTPTEAPTRVILTARTAGAADQTAFFDPDPAITEAEAEALLHRVEGALTEGGVEAVSLSGSSPAPATHGLYSDLIALARSRRVPVFLDTYGPALEGIWGFWPEVMQLNRREAGLHLRTPRPSDAEVFGLLDAWGRHGVRLGVVTDGPGPVLVRSRGGERLRALPPTIDAVNPIGSGDCLLAGLVDAWLSGAEPAAMLRRGLACAVANALVWDAGALDPEEVRHREGAIVIEPATGL